MLFLFKVASIFLLARDRSAHSISINSDLYIVDEFFLTVPGLIFNIYMISRLRHITISNLWWYACRRLSGFREHYNIIHNHIDAS